MAGAWKRFSCALAAAGLAACDGGFLRRTEAVFAAEPVPLVFGPTALGQSRSQTLAIENRGRAVLRVRQAASDLPGVAFSGFEPFELRAGERNELTVTFAPQVEGRITGLLSIETDSESAGEGGVAKIPAQALGVNAYVTVAPERIDFGDVEIGSVKMAQLELQNPTSVEAPVRVTIEGGDAAMFTSADARAPFVVPPGEGKQLAFAFSPNRLAAAQAFAKVEICAVCEPVYVELAGFGISSILDVRPLRIEFGRVAVGSRAEEKLTLTNLGSEPLAFDGLAWVGATAFTFDPVAPRVLAQGESVSATVRFAPTAPGTVPPALLHVKAKAKNSDGPLLPVTAEIGQGCVLVLPRLLDFGLVPEGMSATRRVDIFNRCGRSVQAGDFVLTAQSGGFFSLAQPNATLTIGTGGIGSVRVTFTPKPGSGLSSARLGFKVLSGTTSSHEEVELRGSTRAFAPCSYSVVPPAVDYGRVNVGSEVTLGVAVRNDGADACFVSTMQLAVGSDPPFSAEPVGPVLVDPGKTALLPVKLKPTQVGTFRAMVEAFVNHPTLGRATAMLTGEGIQGCLRLQPSTVDFGTVRLSCGSRTRQVLAVNACTGNVTLNGASIAAGTSGEMSLAVAPAMPAVLSPGQSAQLSVRYAPVDDGDDAAALRVDATPGGTQTVGLFARGVVKPTKTDRYVQEPQGKVDLLFVIDNSGSMMEEQQSVGQNFASLMSAAQSSGVDYQIGVTTTGLEPSPGGWSVCPGGAEGGENGRLFPVNGASPRIIRPTTPNAAAVFSTNVQVGWCHWNEQGLEAAYRALSSPLVDNADDPRTAQGNDGNLGFLRSDAKLAIVIVSDEEDFSPQPPSFYTTFFQALKGNDPSMLSVSVIVGPTNLATCATASSSGTRYMQVAKDTGGVIESICTPNWADSLKNISTNAFGPKRRFPLTELPANPSQIVVEVNGQVLTSGWTYDAATNSIVFDARVAPPAGSVVDITYPLGC